MPGRGLPLLLFALVATGCTPLADLTTPDATPRPTPVPTATPTSDPSTTVTPTATVVPTPTLDPAAAELIELEVTGCPGGVVVDWSPATRAEFHHYLALRSIEPEVETAYPPIAPAVDWGDSYATDRFITSAVDSTLIPSDTVLYYRVMGYDASDRVVAASPVQSTNLFEVEELASIEATPSAGPGSTLLRWGRFGGPEGCFSGYHIRVGPAGFAPTTTLSVVSDQSETELVTSGLHSGQSYSIAVEAMRSTTLGSFVVARTQVAAYTVP